MRMHGCFRSQPWIYMFTMYFKSLSAICFVPRRHNFKSIVDQKLLPTDGTQGQRVDGNANKCQDARQHPADALLRLGERHNTPAVHHLHMMLSAACI